MGFLSQDELKTLVPAETAAFPGPIPTQIVSSDEYFPSPQTARQRELEARTKALGDALARRHGMSRRQFFRTASMAAAFLAMNEVDGGLYDVTGAEAQTPEMAKERAGALRGAGFAHGQIDGLRRPGQTRTPWPGDAAQSNASP